MLIQTEAWTMTITPRMLDELLEGCERPEDLLGDGGLMKELKRARRCAGVAPLSRTGFGLGRAFAGTVGLVGCFELYG